MNSETPSILELIAGTLLLLLLTGWLIGGTGYDTTPPRNEPAMTTAVSRDNVTQELEGRGVPRAAGWRLSYFIAGDVVTKKLLPGITIEQALLLHKAFPSFTTEWDGLWRLIWRGKPVQYMLAPAHQNWPWSDLLAGLIWIGLPAEQVLVAWGQPDTVNHTITANGTLEQWVYEEGESSITLPDIMQEPEKRGTLLNLRVSSIINNDGVLPMSLSHTNTAYVYFKNSIVVTIQY